MTAPTTAAVAGVATYNALDNAYRAAVARTALTVTQVLLLRWRAVQAGSLRPSAQPWLSEAVEAILAGQRNAVQIANTYASQVRSLSLPGEAFTPPPARPPNAEQIRTSLEFQAINTTERALRRQSSVRQGERLDPEVDQDSADRSLAGSERQEMEAAIRRAAGSAIRLVVASGQDQILDVVAADTKAQGWARTTKPGCCYFCAMLASRGFVYKEDSFSRSDPRFIGPGQHKVHDHCGCGLRPVYAGGPLPDRVAELDQLWTSVSGDNPGRSNAEIIQAFRKAYEASPLARPADVA